MSVFYLAGGLLTRMGCKLRPYEREKGATDRAIQESLGLFASACLGHLSKMDAVQQVVSRFEQIQVKQEKRPKIAIFGDLKHWAYKNNGIVLVTNQPESEFNKAPDHILRPFGDKSQFAAKEIWKTEIMDRKPAYTNIRISAFRSRSIGHRTKIMDMKISSNGVELRGQMNEK